MKLKKSISILLSLMIIVTSLSPIYAKPYSSNNDVPSIVPFYNDWTGPGDENGGNTYNGYKVVESHIYTKYVIADEYDRRFGNNAFKDLLTDYGSYALGKALSKFGRWTDWVVRGLGVSIKLAREVKRSQFESWMNDVVMGYATYLKVIIVIDPVRGYRTFYELD